MRKIISILLLVAMLLPMTNFVFLFDYNKNTNVGSCLSKTDVFEVQYELCKQAKNMIVNFSDIVINDLQILYCYTHTLKLFIDQQMVFINNFIIKIYNNIEIYKVVVVKNNISINDILKVNILFLMFVFVFLIRYLGLLRLFNSPLNLKLYLIKEHRGI